MQNAHVKSLKALMTDNNQDISDFEFQHDRVLIPATSVHAGWIMLVSEDIEFVEIDDDVI